MGCFISQADGPNKRRPRTENYVATEGSLKKAAEIAEKLGVPMDRGRVADQARNLLALHFADIQAIHPEMSSHIKFEDLATNRMAIFAGMAGQNPLIFHDQHFSQWLFGMNLITVIFSCYNLNTDQLQELGALLERRLYQWHYPFDHKEIRDAEWAWHLNHVEALPLVNGLSKAMDVFTMCHEIAHIHLNHHEKVNDLSHEFAADLSGYKMLRAVQQSADLVNVAKLDAKMLAAPCISLGYLELLER